MCTAGHGNGRKLDPMASYALWVQYTYQIQLVLWERKTNCIDQSFVEYRIKRIKKSKDGESVLPGTSKDGEFELWLGWDGERE